MYFYEVKMNEKKATPPNKKQQQKFIRRGFYINFRRQYFYPKFKGWVLTNNFVIIACTFLVLYTSVFFFQYDTREVTMSYIGNHGHKLLFVTWGIATASLVGLMLLNIYKSYNYQNKVSRNLIIAGALSLVNCVFVPSLASLPRYITGVHDLSAVAYAVFSIFGLVFFILYLSKVDKQIGKRSFWMFMIMLLFPFISLVLFGHCGVYEIVFFICLVVYVLFLYFYLSKNKTRLQKNIEIYNQQKNKKEANIKTKKLQNQNLKHKQHNHDVDTPKADNRDEQNNKINHTQQNNQDKLNN